MLKTKRNKYNKNKFLYSILEYADSVLGKNQYVTSYLPNGQKSRTGKRSFLRSDKRYFRYVRGW